ncbi:MAG TPA: nickel pincer cofactor biosynthesis protein LarC [Nitrospiraceae bacterium]|nr:nickel pincer cofactor biosynthesis protein LarC [Nitrospiraceae bacterium]
MTLAYFDCFSGISGDMTLGALVDAGVSIEDLRAELAKLDLPGYEITTEKVTRSGLAATKVDVILDKKEQPARRLPDIRTIIEKSSLSPAIKKNSMTIFERLAEAEARVHGTTIDKVHFHEVGAVDAIVDIVGSVIGLELLRITKIIGSPVNTGSGSVHTSHGRLPVPAPATAELLRGIPLYNSSVAFELTTPTGAAIISTISSFFGPLPQMKLDRVAYGAGNKDLPGQPNVLRLMIGEPVAEYEEDASMIIETNIDDMNPQVYDYLIERLMHEGAQDAYLVPIIMKKGRPAVLLSVLTDKANMDAVLDTVFRESTSIGVRIHEVGRRKLNRETHEVTTSYGTIRVKVSKRGDEILTVTPEYEDCKRIAKEKQVPLKAVMEEARKAFTKK